MGIKYVRRQLGKMEFLYYAVTNNETMPVKGKISKWRHLESMITKLILLGLVFFIILQNGNIKRSMNEKLSHELIEDIISDKIAQLNKQFEQVKQTIIMADAKRSLQAQQVKLLIRVLAKELGLPIPGSAEQNKIEEKKIPTISMSFKEEDEQNSEDISYNEESDFSAEEEHNDAFNEERVEEQTEQQSEQNQEEEVIFEVKRKEVVSIEIRSDNQKQEFDLQNSTKDHKKNNDGRKEDKEVRNFIFGEYEDQIKNLLVLSSHILIIFLALVCIFVLFSFVNNPKANKVSDQALQQVLKIGSKDSKDSLKMSKREYLKLQ